MSPVRPSGGESLQEMIDRYNRELMKMGRLSKSGQQPVHLPHHPEPHEAAKPSAPAHGIRPRPEPDEPLYAPDSGMPRPLPSEPLDEPLPPSFNAGAGAREQGMQDIAQGHKDREQGMRDIAQGHKDRGQGMRDIAQGHKDREQGMRDIAQGHKDREQGMRDIAQGHKDRGQGMRDIEPSRSDLRHELDELKQRLLALEQMKRDILRVSTWQEHGHTSDRVSPFSLPAVTAAASPEDERAQWLRDLEQGRRELEQGLRDLEEGLRDRDQGVRDYEQGLAEREYWLSQGSAVPANTVPTNTPPANSASMNLPSSDFASGVQPSAARSEVMPIPVSPTVPGRVPAQHNSTTAKNSGTLIVQVYTASRARPVPGARVVVTRLSNNGEILYDVLYTDEDGRTPPASLPVEGTAHGAPDYSAPFVNYRVYVTADGFQPRGPMDAQIFAGITGLLPVELIPGEQVMS